ncbi:hypothetical protein GSI_02822 [Ganoderma sinense ZZ0214-1]|uniref:Uncharacterized protein n=1 Tax=Ganoderma sinense ZZ0214-1 TaxID=1077348 RepID=A0A2G8SMN9_9APHY|nr:hypothetical protein GSI_02822 [Ganoderma sinense ZZ0214-1]
MEAEQRRRQAQQAIADREAAKARAVRIRFLEGLVKEERSRLRRRYSGRYWTVSDAINHFTTAGSAFDSARFTMENPPIFDKVPWPTLLPPWELKEEQVNWEQVESFFKKAYARMPTQDYKELVEKAHKRFHPDRWRARQFWKTIGDQEWVEKLDTVANKVSQAVSPIWIESRNM